MPSASAVAVCFFTTLAAASAASCLNIPTVDTVSLADYLGKW
jgi:hypothetical protein